MSQSRQEIRARIKSVDSTRKITKAMEMIANAKLVKQRAKMEANREYAQQLQDTVNEIAVKNPDAECRYLRPTDGIRTMTIIFCSDLGFCGAYNQNIMRLVKEKLNPEDPIFLVGTSLMRQLKEAGFNVVNEAPVSSDKITFLELKDIVMEATARYRHYEVDRVHLLYTKFVNTMTFEAGFDEILPFEMEEIETPQNTAEDQEKLKAETLFEPDAGTILDELIPMMIQNVAYADWMESTTAEQGSRRMAMKTATDNADDLSESLLLEYNKARQASITQEITEIVGGSAAV